MIRARVLLADDHRIVTEGLRSLLELEFDLVGIVEDGRALVKAGARLHPDVIIADISMPLLNGIEAVRQIRKAGSRAKVVFLTMHPDVTYAVQAFDAGGTGFVLKHSAPSELLTAIHEVLKGHTYVSPMITKELLENYRRRAEHREAPSGRLSGRQREILQLLAEGRPAKEIARILNISPRTVEFHKYRIMRMLDLHSSAEVVRYAINHGII